MFAGGKNICIPLRGRFANASAFAGFAEKRVRWHFREKMTEGGCKAKCTGVIKKGAFRKHRFFMYFLF